MSRVSREPVKVQVQNMASMETLDQPLVVMSSEEDQELREAFDLFDKEGDGKLGAEELHIVM